MSGFESYPHYQDYLNQARIWPSESGGNTRKITDMVPRYAASAHAKLFRWATTMSAGVALNIHDATERISYVRQTPLAIALARAAQGLPPQSEVISEWQTVDKRDLVLAFAPVVAEHTDLDITTIFKLCEALAETASTEWTVLAQSR